MERQQALIDFKRKMASETEALLVEQEKELGVLIGRLEVCGLIFALDILINITKIIIY